MPHVAGKPWSASGREVAAAPNEFRTGSRAKHRLAAATADWCWVLDADNTLDKQACGAAWPCQNSPENTAVIHPLIRIRDDRGAIHGWAEAMPAAEQLQAGNVVDAMASGRSAWEAVVTATSQEAGRILISGASSLMPIGMV